MSHQYPVGIHMLKDSIGLEKEERSEREGGDDRTPKKDLEIVLQ